MQRTIIILGSNPFSTWRWKNDILVCVDTRRMCYYRDRFVDDSMGVRMNDDVDLDPTTHMRYIVLPAYSTKGKMLPQKQSGRTATPTNPYGNRWKKGRINCPICGYPLANDIDDKGNFRGLVCMSEGQKGEYTPNNRPRKRCPNFGKIVYRTKEEALTWTD